MMLRTAWLGCMLAALPLTASTLELIRTIPLPGVAGRIDHFAFDAAGSRLFIAALGNNTVEIVDLRQGKVTHTINGLAEPQDVCFVPELNRLYVSNGGDGALQIYDGTNFAPVGTVSFSRDADNMRYDTAAKRLYVGYGSAIGEVDVSTNAIVGDIRLEAHPESFQLEKSTESIFINVPSAHEIAVANRAQHKVIATWPLGLVAANFPLALDEANHRLFIGCRLPARLLVFNAQSGKELLKLRLHGDCDDLFFDKKCRRIYASCGEGFIDVFTQTDADHYALIESIKTAAQARTCFFDGQKIYIAVPKRGEQGAAVRIYETR